MRSQAAAPSQTNQVVIRNFISFNSPGMWEYLALCFLFSFSFFLIRVLCFLDWQEHKYLQNLLCFWLAGAEESARINCFSSHDARMRALKCMIWVILCTSSEWRAEKNEEITLSYKFVTILVERLCSIFPLLELFTGRTSLGLSLFDLYCCSIFGTLRWSTRQDVQGAIPCNSCPGVFLPGWGKSAVCLWNIYALLLIYCVGV